jgi:hypothetical protein
MTIIVNSLFSLTEKQIYTLDTAKNTLILEYFGAQNYNFTSTQNQSLELPDGEIIEMNQHIDIDGIRVLVCSIESCKLTRDNILVVQMRIMVLKDIHQAFNVVF